MRKWPRIIGAIACAVGMAACERSRSTDGDRPSLLLAVLDTTRMDAVSAYGFVDGTTPTIDALARDGLLYQWALAPAPWTLPSHATLFTSLGPEQHGVGVAGRMVLGGDYPTLAERLRAAGYETLGFSENPIVGAQLGLARGFDHFEGESDAAAARKADPTAGFDVVLGVTRWAERRSGERPFFVFVNLFDPHDPYAMHDEHSYLPAGTDLEDARRMSRADRLRGIAESAGICDHLPPRRELEIMRGLYLGEVASADAKLGRILDALRAAARGPLVTIVTADHGEHLGEHGLLGHEFSLRGEVLRVPLIVHGLPGGRPAVISSAVGLGDVAPSLLRWLALEPPAAWSAGHLPLGPEASSEMRAMRALYADAPLIAPEGMRTDHAVQASRRRRGCGDRNRVFGEILSLVRFPFKLVWFERYRAQLYDLRWDPRELSDIARYQPERVEGMVRELSSWRDRLAAIGAEAGQAAPPEAIEALRALGYIE